MRFVLRTLHDTTVLGRAFGSLLRPGDIIGLIGDLGAGKTTLTQAIASGMGISEPVTSPTFTLIQEYSGRIPLYHFDSYRLERPEEIGELGLYEYLERDGVVVVEWADRISGLLPAVRFEINLRILEHQADDIMDAAPRELIIAGYGKRPAAVVEQLGAITVVAAQC